MHTGGGIRTTFEVFREIFLVFLALGTVVGVVVIGYMVYNAYRYRDGNGTVSGDVDRPQLGELPGGGGSGKKLFVSFGISAFIVVSLIGWTYGMLQDVEDGPPEAEAEEPLHVEVTGYQFGWRFEYPNGHTNTTLRVPADRAVRLSVTSDDVFHTLGIPSQRIKTDAIPGQTTRTWFIAEEPGEFEVRCYELCGEGHSYMVADGVVMERASFQRWYANTSADGEDSDAANETSSDGNETDDGNETSSDDHDSSAAVAARGPPAIERAALPRGSTVTPIQA
jgi:cytochrome c oxidase subunit 2